MAAREPFPIHPRMQAVTLEVILRAVFGVTDPARLERLRAMLALMLANMASPRLQIRALVAQRFGREDPIERAAPADQRRRRAAVRRDRRAARRPEARPSATDILSMLVAARFEDGEPMTTASCATS